jgi:hypothetical protein
LPVVIPHDSNDDSNDARRGERPQEVTWSPPLAANIIDLARNKMQVMAAAAVTVSMTAATLKVPRLTG